MAMIKPIKPIPGTPIKDGPVYGRPVKLPPTGSKMPPKQMPGNMERMPRITPDMPGDDVYRTLPVDPNRKYSGDKTLGNPLEEAKKRAAMAKMTMSKSSPMSAVASAMVKRK